VPLYNSSSFELRPADATYSGGDYWLPHVADSIHAPEDKLPVQYYPLQAIGDAVRLVPATARGDALDHRFARYIDQVDARSRECDTVSPDCTVSCLAGDLVTLAIGSLMTAAKVVSSQVLGNALTIEFTPEAGQAQGVDPLQCNGAQACSIFRPCYNAVSGCTAQEGRPSQILDTIETTYVCPTGFAICTTVQQLLVATLAKKDGKVCVASADSPVVAPVVGPASWHQWLAAAAPNSVAPTQEGAMQAKMKRKKAKKSKTKVAHRW
jgi:hypothetical protein